MSAFWYDMIMIMISHFYLPQYMIRRNPRGVGVASHASLINLPCAYMHPISTISASQISLVVSILIRSHQRRLDASSLRCRCRPSRYPQLFIANIPFWDHITISIDQHMPTGTTIVTSKVAFKGAHQTTMATEVKKGRNLSFHFFSSRNSIQAICPKI